MENSWTFFFFFYVVWERKKKDPKRAVEIGSFISSFKFFGYLFGGEKTSVERVGCLSVWPLSPFMRNKFVV